MVRLDFDTQRLLDEWLNNNLPYIADESQEQLTRDAQAIALAAREQGATPEQAMKRLPKFWALQLGWDTTYLRRRDIEFLEWVRRQQGKGAGNVFVRYLGLVVGVALLTLSPLIGLLWPIAIGAIPLAFIGGLVMTSSCLVRIMVHEPVERVFRVGVPILLFHGVATLFAAGLGLQKLSESVFDRGDVLILIYPLCYLYGMMLSFKFATRLECNSEIVARILGVESGN